MDKKTKGYQTSIIGGSIIIGVCILFSNGIYTFESKNVGVTQRNNIFTGSMELCHIVQKESKCQSLSEGKSDRNFLSLEETGTNSIGAEFLKKIRAKYPQYNDMPDETLVRTLHKKYNDKTGAGLSLAAFQESISYRAILKTVQIESE